MHNPRMIETRRLTLMKPSLADFDEFHAMRSDTTLTKLLGSTPVSREDAWNKLLRNIGRWTAFGYGIFTVRDKIRGDLIGEVGLAHVSRGLGEAFDPFPEAAWILAAAGHGRGYATEAAVAAHDWMARTHQRSRTVCIIHPGNRASIRVAEKLGYAGIGDASYRGTSLTMFERRKAVPP